MHGRGVASGVWNVAEQRPERLIAGLAASAWHDPQRFAVCRALEAGYEMTRSCNV